MFRRFLHFIQYHNATNWVIFGLLFAGLGTAFAATATDALVTEDRTIIAVDNSALLALDLALFDTRLQIIEVTEDSENYYAAYVFTTLALNEGTWQETMRDDVLAVSKQELGERDLGLYLAEELGEVTRHERAYLTEVQMIERKKGETRKTVAIEYGGLVGKLFDPTEEVFANYTPVVEEPERPQEHERANDEFRISNQGMNDAMMNEVTNVDNTIEEESVVPESEVADAETTPEDTTLTASDTETEPLAETETEILTDAETSGATPTESQDETPSESSPDAPTEPTTEENTAPQS